MARTTAASSMEGADTAGKGDTVCADQATSAWSASIAPAARGPVVPNEVRRSRPPSRDLDAGTARQQLSHVQAEVIIVRRRCTRHWASA